MRRFPEATIEVEDGVVHVTIGELDARAQLEPAGRVTMALPADGFELCVRWTDRHRSARPAHSDDSYLVETNDIALAHSWLDHDARAALLASRYVSDTPAPMRATARLVRDGAWQHFIRDGEVGAERADVEMQPDRVADVLAATLALAKRPTRWARLYGSLAKELGGEACARVEVGGRPVVRVRRGRTEVVVRLLRKLRADEPGRLRTLISAHRHGSGGDTLALISDDLPRTAWPPSTDSELATTLRVDARASALVEIAQPATAFVRAHDVEITFDGALVERERLSAAIELASRWADAGGDGPYR